MDSPSRDDGVTIACPCCGRGFRPLGRRRFCSAACRQAAWRRRQQAPSPPLPLAVSRRATIYACPTCETRYLGTQYCPECSQFCRRIGPGGPCPHCEEPVALADLLTVEGR